MTRRLQINFILGAFVREPVGGNKVIYDHANFLASKGYQVRLIFPRSVTTEPLGVLGQLRGSAWALRRRLRHRPLIAWHPLDKRIQVRLVSNLNAKALPNADMTVATAWMTADPVALLPGKGAKFYLIQGHETWAGDTDAVNATWLLPLQKIVVSKWLQDIGDRLGAQDMTHIPNGLDLTIFQVTGQPAARPLSVLAAYHTAEAKGLSDALVALEAYHSRFPDVPIGMFGTRPQAEGLPAWIDYHGGLTGAGLATLYNRYSIFTSASRSEGWALTPAEAMACGCVFVGTDSGGVTDYAIDGETALLSPPSDPQALLVNLVRVTEDQALRHRLQTAGHRAIQQFTLEKSNAALERRLLEGATK